MDVGADKGKNSSRASANMVKTGAKIGLKTDKGVKKEKTQALDRKEKQSKGRQEIGTTTKGKQPSRVGQIKEVSRVSKDLDKQKEVSEVNQKEIQDIKALNEQGACMINVTDEVEVDFLLELARLQSLCIKQGVEIVDLPVAIDFPPDKLVPTFDVNFYPGDKLLS